ncbi:GTPase Ryh1 [Tritrichomonas musculus]|uniref:GTPase Ryh1 n=1 Tax=Tritrichomonas musculus TaxID=1915356 RepID=A0ABR2H739_9EUKA
MQELNESYKIIFVGDSGTGKTSIINSYFEISTVKIIKDKDSNLNIPAPTIGASQLTIYHKNVALRIWDTAGQENYRAILPLYFKNSSLAIIAFDISNRTSFDHLTKDARTKPNSDQNETNIKKTDLFESGSWIDLVAQYAPKECKIIIVGNKSDLQNKRQVSASEGENLVKKINTFYQKETFEKALFYIETSTIDNSNIYDLFDQAFESKDCLIKKYVSQDFLPNDENNKTTENNDKQGSGCC